MSTSIFAAMLRLAKASKRLLLSLALAYVAASWVASEWVRGQIVEASEAGQVTIRHEAIKSLGMGAMTRLFLVDDKVSLKAFKQGDRVKFSFHVSGNYIKIDALVHDK